MKGVSSDVAAREVRNACRKKFQVKKVDPISLPASAIASISSTIEHFEYPTTSRSTIKRETIEHVLKTGGYTLKVYNGTNAFWITEMLVELDIEGYGKRRFWAKYSRPFEGGLRPLSTGNFEVRPRDLITSATHHVIEVKGFLKE